MSLRVAAIVDRMPVRIGLLCVVLAATLLFAPWALFGASVGFDAYLRAEAPDAPQWRWMLWAGLGGVCGLAGAWIRLLYCAEQLDPHPRLKYAAAAALGIGGVTALALLAGVGMNVADPHFWAYALAAIACAVLLMAIVQRAPSAA